MAKLNQKRRVESAPLVRTHEGALVKKCGEFEQLKRSVLSCMLWENEFYEDGKTITQRISELIAKCDGQSVQDLTIAARSKYKLRHAPLFMARESVRNPSQREFVSETLANIIQRPDELSEFMAMYWELKESKDRYGKSTGDITMKKQPIAASVKKGLAKAFTKFDEYQLAKWNRDSAIKLRDVLFLCHAKPQGAEQEILWKKLIGGFCKNTWTKIEECKCGNCKEAKLAIPDTWETNLSAGSNKKETFERLMKENKLGGIALLSNLRNMTEAGCDQGLVRAALKSMKVEKILPFRFITAAKYAPCLEDALEEAMLRCLGGMKKMPGKTVLLVDISGSMDWSKISGKSELTRKDAAIALAMLAREVCEEVEVVAFETKVHYCRPRRGFALRDEINSKGSGGTNLASAIKDINSKMKYDRMIVFTDEQSNDGIAQTVPGAKGYILNVASNQNGVGYGNNWTHVHGFSEHTFEWIQEFETM